MVESAAVDNNAEHIRRVAARRFAEHGFDGTSLQAIADEVGITKPSLLYHYPSKETLRQAVLDDVFAHWQRTLPQLLDAVTSGERRFEALTEELIRFFRADPNRARLVMREILDRPDEFQRDVSPALRTWVALIAEYIRKGKKSGELHPDVDGEAYVLHVIVAVIASVAALPALAAVLQPQPTSEPTTERHLRELVRLVRTGLFRAQQESGT